MDPLVGFQIKKSRNLPLLSERWSVSSILPWRSTGGFLAGGFSSEQTQCTANNCFACSSLYRIVQYHLSMHCTQLLCTVLLCTELHKTMLLCTISHKIILQCFAWICTTLDCTRLHCYALHRIAQDCWLHCIGL